MTNTQLCFLCINTFNAKTKLCAFVYAKIYYMQKYSWLIKQFRYDYMNQIENDTINILNQYLKKSNLNLQKRFNVLQHISYIHDTLNLYINIISNMKK